MVVSYSLAVCLINYIHDTIALFVDIKIILNSDLKTETLLITLVCLAYVVGIERSTENSLKYRWDKSVIFPLLRQWISFPTDKLEC